MKVGDIVTITVQYPYLVINENVFGEVGIIADIENGYLEVKTDSRDGYWYTKDEIRLATETEIKEKLRKLLA